MNLLLYEIGDTGRERQIRDSLTVIMHMYMSIQQNRYGICILNIQELIDFCGAKSPVLTTIRNQHHDKYKGHYTTPTHHAFDGCGGVDVGANLWGRRGYCT